MAILLSLLFMDVFIFLALAQEHDVAVADALTGLVVVVVFQPRSTMPDLFELLKNVGRDSEVWKQAILNRG